MGDPGGGDHVRGTRPDRRGRRHDLAATNGLVVRHGGQRHALLVLAAPRRQDVTAFFQRVAETRHVAVAEDAVDAGEQRRDGAIAQLGGLGDHVADDGLGNGQTLCAHGSSFGMVCGRRCVPVGANRQASRVTDSHFSDFQLVSSADCTLT